MLEHNKILLLYSGGLDSRLATEVLLTEGAKITAAFFRLPFSGEKHVKDDFLKERNITMEIFDCTKGELLHAYLESVKNAKYGRGAGYNPCTDCKIFMFQQASEFAEKHGFEAIATGEVPGQRPMSQTSDKMKIINKSFDFPLIRPLSDIGIQGRGRKKQIEMARRYDFDFPSPGGGCLLCDKQLGPRFKMLIENDLINEETLPVINIGRHYYFDETKEWIIVGRNKEENDVLENHLNCIASSKGKPAVLYNPGENSETKELAREFQNIYMKKDREKIDSYKKWKY
jgi:tRNA-specific 2-thiouridylase